MPVAVVVVLVQELSDLDNMAVVMEIRPCKGIMVLQTLAAVAAADNVPVVVVKVRHTVVQE
jgi:hypothetical protein